MTPKEIVLQFVEAFNAGDAEKLASLYAENAENHQVANIPVVGRQSIKKMFQKEFATAKMVCIPQNIFCDGQWAILEWMDPLGYRGCGFFKTENDKIVLQRGYWDKLTILKHSFQQDFAESKRQFLSLVQKTQKVLLKLKEGSPAHTLSLRRLKAYRLALDLIDGEMDK